MTYIAFNQHGTEIGRGSAYSVGHDMLTYDGHEYEIRQEDGAFKLFVSRFSSSSTIGAADKSEWSLYEATTEAGVFENIVKDGGVCKTYAMTEAEHEAMLAEAAA